ncbi:hypothetical protein [uncultured Gammaproteobacteria bacterium]|nr:hypothetical protein [uncultured Gammaproteobacteria bacterium]
MDARLEWGWFFRILIGIFWVGWLYFWIWIWVYFIFISIFLFRFLVL